MRKEDFDGIMQSMEEARRWARGEHVPGLRVHYFPTDVRAIHHGTGLSPAEFSRQIGVSTATLRNWEQRRRKPEGPARILLAMLARDPAIVTRALAGARLILSFHDGANAAFRSACEADLRPLLVRRKESVAAEKRSYVFTEGTRPTN